MGLVERVQRWIRGSEPTLVDYETYEQAAQAGREAEEERAQEMGGGVLGKVGPGMQVGSGATVPPGVAVGLNAGGTYKIQQSYDALLQTVQELRNALDGQAQRENGLLERLGTMRPAAEALPQASQMQADMLKIINDRLAMHAEQQRKVTSVVNALGGGIAGASAGGGAAKKEYSEVLQGLREQIEMGNEIDRQLVDSFNRFSMMIDRLQLANQHAVDALQQVRDSYMASAMQMQEWIEKSRHRNSWLVGGAFLMSAASLAIVLVLIIKLMQAAR